MYGVNKCIFVSALDKGNTITKYLILEVKYNILVNVYKSKYLLNNHSKNLFFRIHSMLHYIAIYILFGIFLELSVTMMIIDKKI
jgi:hypothetical protein